jgi:hypothetical protein
MVATMTHAAPRSLAVSRPWKDPFQSLGSIIDPTAYLPLNLTERV